MSNATKNPLKELQRLDGEIKQAEKKVSEFSSTTSTVPRSSSKAKPLPPRRGSRR